MLRSILEQLLSKAWALITALFGYLIQFVNYLLTKMFSLMPLNGMDVSGNPETVDDSGLSFVMSFFPANTVFQFVVGISLVLAICFLYKLLVKLLRG